MCQLHELGIEVFYEIDNVKSLHIFYILHFTEMISFIINL